MPFLFFERKKISMVEWKSWLTSPVFWIVIIGIGAILFVIIYFSVKGSQKDPGVAWKVPYSTYPELREIYEAFKQSCKIPEVPQRYFEDIAKDADYQTMRNDCKNLPDEKKYSDLELRKEGAKYFNIDKFTEQGNEAYKIPNSEYSVRGGCFARQIPNEIEQVAQKNIEKLMQRLNLPNRLERETDSRGTTYMPPGGFMEYHTNQNHYGGWRLYMHYLPENGNSWFVYQHPYEKSYHKIADNNESANMFRIRKPPKNLLWHAIYSDTHRFSWGIWLPPELAQHLKQFGTRQ